MFTLIELKPNLFDQQTPKELKIIEAATTCFTVHTSVINQLLSNNNYPIEKRKAITNILVFLEYLDNELHENRKENRKDRIEIPQSVFIDFFTRDQYQKYKKLLHKFQILSLTSHPNGSSYISPDFAKRYNQGKPKEQHITPKCQLYKVHRNYENNTKITVVIPINDKHIPIIVDSDIKGLNKRYINTIKSLQINIKDASLAEIEYYRRGNCTIKQLKTRLQRIFYTKRKRFIKYGKKVDRIYHSFSNVSRISRQHINIDMYYIDICNSQPLILCALINSQGKNLDTNYQNDCENGKFYENFKYLYPEEDDNNMLLKKDVLRHIFFGWKPWEAINKRFKELFPNVWEFLYENSKKETSLASQLQNMESDLFNIIIPVKSKYFFTLFDAIYFSDDKDEGKLQLDIIKFFGDYGLNVKTKFEPNKK